MKAWRIVGYGTIADGVRMHVVTVPQLGPREVLIRGAAASI
ncbi:NADPH:quinone oxidoreductase family protein, partial [Oxalobacteraceae bacterium OM1]